MDPIQQIKDRLSIEELVGAYLPLKPAGRYLKACCPFHQEKTPSFFVNPEKQIAYCFACQKGGDIFEFVQLIEGMSFKEALEYLAERAHVDLPKNSPEKGLPKDEKERLYLAHDLANNFFVQNIWNGEDGLKVLNYLRKRGFSDAVLKEFSVGFAPEQGDALYRNLLEHGLKGPELLKSGLVLSRDAEARSFKDRFQLRLMIPIADGAGRLVAFGGRALKAEEQPKYLNSPESPLYKKSSILFNLHRAKPFIRDVEHVTVVEGYLDAMAAHQMGESAVVATCGTAMTHDQFKLLKRLTGTVVLAFDSDSAGQDALRRACLEALPLGLQVQVLVLKNFKDAAEVLMQGSSAFTEAVAGRTSWFDHFLQLYSARYSIEDPVQKRFFSDAMLELIGAVPHPVEKEAYLHQLSKTLGVPQDLLRFTSKSTSRLRAAAEPALEKPKPEVQLLKRFLSFFLAFPSEFVTLWERYENPELLMRDLQGTSDMESLILRPDRMSAAAFAQFHLQFADFLASLDPDSSISSVYKEQISHYTPQAQWDESFLLEHPERAQLQALQFQAQVQASQGVSVLSELTQLIAQLYLAYLRSPFHGSN